MSNKRMTSISTISPQQILVRGYDLCEMVGKYTFGDVLYLLMSGELPQKHEGRMIEAILVACSEHSLNAPSTQTSRIVAGCGVAVQTAIAAGINAIGEYHGGAGEACAKILQEAVSENIGTPAADLATRLVNELHQAGIRFPGFGHRFHTPFDPRAERLLALADQWGFRGSHTVLALAITSELKRVTGRDLPLNVDGALAAILSDMGLDWRFSKSVYIVARTAGLAAHVHEEMTTGKPLEFAGKHPFEYTGPAERPLPGV